MVRSSDSSQQQQNNGGSCSPLVDVDDIDLDDSWAKRSGSSSSSSTRGDSSTATMQLMMNGASGQGGNTANAPDQDRRLRRQIANCNERRRMQSINAGFHSLRLLLPHGDGEKLSKAAILQQTADLIQRLVAERDSLVRERNGGSNGSGSAVTASKRRRTEEEDENEAITREAAAKGGQRLRQREVRELRLELEQERQQRLAIERQLASLRALLGQDGGAAETKSSKTPSPSSTGVIVRHSGSAFAPPVQQQLQQIQQQQQQQPAAPTAIYPTTAVQHDPSTRSLHTILEAIRHLESMKTSPPPAAAQQHHSNLLVR